MTRRRQRTRPDVGVLAVATPVPGGVGELVQRYVVTSPIVLSRVRVVLGDLAAHVHAVRQGAALFPDHDTTVVVHGLDTFIEDTACHDALTVLLRYGRGAAVNLLFHAGPIPYAQSA